MRWTTLFGALGCLSWLLLAGAVGGTALPTSDTPNDRSGTEHRREADYDCVIRGGQIIDGTGAPRFAGDVAIANGRIVAIGSDLGAGRLEIDAAGQVVAPGFVDLMGQSATALMDRPQAALNLLSQGITTINCGEGVSAAPLSPAEETRQGWTTFREYFALLDMQGLPLNVVQTIGHTQVRSLVLGDVDRRPSPEELLQMQAHVAEAMEAGAIGVSTALIYPPAIYAPTEEIVALVEVAGRAGGGYYTHMRNEGDRLLEAIEEALEIGRRGNSSVHIFHLKTAGKQNWDKMHQAIAALRAAQAAGQAVSADIYPYLHNGLPITAMVPPEYFAQGPTALMIRLDQDRDHADEQQRGALRRQIRRELETTTGWENWFRHVGFDWQRILLGHTEHARYRAGVGQSIAALAEQFQQDPWDVFFELLRAGAFVLPESMNEDNKILALQQDFMAFCTDVGPAEGASYAAHPRAYGAFPRLLARYVREKRVLSLEQAIAQATAVAARHVKLTDRGRIAVGQAADLVIFDPETIADQATFAQPDQLSTGIAQVLVNGQVVYQNGQLADVRPGRVLRGPGWRAEQRPAAQRDSAQQPTLAAFDELGRQFLERHAGVGLAIAVTDQGRLVHAAGYGYADLAQATPVTPQSLFRIASVSKPITALAILKLREQGLLDLDDPLLSHLSLEPAIAAAGDAFDPRWRDITIRHLLEHRGGWDRQQSFDAMFRSVDFAQSLGLPPPAAAGGVITAMLRQPLDFNPGQRYAYSNLGYNLLGRLIEQKTGQDYGSYVEQKLLEPLGITRMRLGRTRLEQRQTDEVRYYHPGEARSVFAADLDQRVPSPYGAWHLEAMDAHGGWLASAVDLARLAAALDDPAACPILTAASLTEIRQRPSEAAGHNGPQPKDVYYGLGWQVRQLAQTTADGQPQFNLWHSGSLPGTATILIRRHDGRNFVALLNSRVSPTGSSVGSDIDPQLHRAAAEVAEWPTVDLFPHFYPD